MCMIKLSVFVGAIAVGLMFHGIANFCATEPWCLVQNGMLFAPWMWRGLSIIVPIIGISVLFWRSK